MILLNGSNNNIELANDVQVTGGGTIDFAQGGPNITGGFKLTNLDNSFTGFGDFLAETEFAAGSLITPGLSSDATTSFDFDATTQIDGTMLIELAGTKVNDGTPNIDLVNTHIHSFTTTLDFDQLNIFDIATFGDNALLDVELADGYIPEVGDFFDVLTADEFDFSSPLDSDLPVLDGLTFSTEILNLFDSSTGTNRDVFRLTFVPEPGPLALIGVLGVTFVLVRRRSRRPAIAVAK